MRVGDRILSAILRGQVPQAFFVEKSTFAVVIFVILMIAHLRDIFAKILSPPSSMPVNRKFQ